MKVGEITQRIHNLYSKGVESDDTRVSNRLIYNKFIGIRARLVQQRLAKGTDKNDFTGWDYQPIGSITMQDHTWTSLNTSCPIKRSVNKLPKTIGDGSSEHIVVTSQDGSIKYNITTFARAKYIAGGKYTSKMPYAFIQDDYLYTVNSKANKVKLLGIFRSPIEAYIMNKINIDGSARCVQYRDVDVYTPDEISDVAIEMASEELIKMFNTMGVEDVRNDSSDNPSDRSK